MWNAGGHHDQGAFAGVVLVLANLDAETAPQQVVELVEVVGMPLDRWAVRRLVADAYLRARGRRRQPLQSHLKRGRLLRGHDVALRVEPAGWSRASAPLLPHLPHSVCCCRQCRRAGVPWSALMLLYSCGFFGLLFSFVLFLSGTWHLSLVQAGAALLPMVGIAFLLTTRVGHLANRVGFRTPLMAGPLCMAAGLMLSAALDAGAHFSTRWLWLAGLVGLGIGLCYPLLGAAAVDGLGPGDLAAATAVNQCARQIGAALGVAAVVPALGTRLPTPAARFHEAWMLCGVFCLAAAGAGLALRPQTSMRDGTLPPASPARQPEAVAE